MSTIYILILVSIYLVIFFYDIRHKIIPDSLSFSLIIITAVFSFFFSFKNGMFQYLGFHIPRPAHVLAALLIPLPFILIWYFSKGKMIGLGDPKLMISIAFLLGMSYGWTAIFLAFWIGAFFSLYVFILRKIHGSKKKKNGLYLKDAHAILKEEIPFAPFLIIATIIVLISGLNLF